MTLAEWPGGPFLPLGQRHLEESLDLTVRRLLPLSSERILNATTYFGVRTIENPLDADVLDSLATGSPLPEYRLRPDARTPHPEPICELLPASRSMGESRYLVHA